MYCGIGIVGTRDLKVLLSLISIRRQGIEFLV